MVLLPMVPMDAEWTSGRRRILSLILNSHWSPSGAMIFFPYETVMYRRKNTNYFYYYLLWCKHDLKTAWFALEKYFICCLLFCEHVSPYKKASILLLYSSREGKPTFLSCSNQHYAISWPSFPYFTNHSTKHSHAQFVTLLGCHYRSVLGIKVSTKMNRENRNVKKSRQET